MKDDNDNLSEAVQKQMNESLTAFDDERRGLFDNSAFQSIVAAQKQTNELLTALDDERRALFDDSAFQSIVAAQKQTNELLTALDDERRALFDSSAFQSIVAAQKQTNELLTALDDERRALDDQQRAFFDDSAFQSIVAAQKQISESLAAFDDQQRALFDDSAFQSIVAAQKQTNELLTAFNDQWRALFDSSGLAEAMQSIAAVQKQTKESLAEAAYSISAALDDSGLAQVAESIAAVQTRMNESLAPFKSIFRHLLDELETEPVDAEVSYQIELSLSAETVPIGGELEVTIELEPAAFASGYGYLLNVLRSELKESELNLILDAPGFQFFDEPVASLPFTDPAPDQTAQRATFRLVALRPGSAEISVDLYRGGAYEGKITQTVNVAGIDQNVTLSRPLILPPRPVAQPDYVLQVHTRWNEKGTACSFHYHLTSSNPVLMLTSGVSADSAQFSTQEVDILRDSWQEVLRETRGGRSMDARLRLVAFGRYLYQSLVPDTLRQELRMLGGVRQVAQSKGRTLLLIADEDAWLPWELLYDDQGRKFLAERVIIGRWLRELGEVPPYEFPVGQVRVAYYERVREQHEWWVDLIEPPGSPRAEALPGGVLENPYETEGLRGLHLLRYGELWGEGEWSFDRLRNQLPVLLADSQKEQTIEGQVQPIKLNLYRNRPLVSLSYISSGRPELTNLIEQWAPTFVRAGCSAFVGPLWTVSLAVEAAFMSGFYHHLWTGGSLGEAFQAGRGLARAANPESLDWLAYVLFGDPMARPYRPIKSEGYAVVEPIGRDLSVALAPGESVLLRASLRRTPPVWHESRVVEVAEDLTFPALEVQVMARDVEVLPQASIPMKAMPTGDYFGWFTIQVPAKPRSVEGMMARKTRLRVFFVNGEQVIHSLTIPFKISDAFGG